MWLIPFLAAWFHTRKTPMSRRRPMPENYSPSDLVVDQTTGEKRPRRKPGPKPGTEAAKRGGTAARDKYGSGFYSRIGTKGGSTVRERHGSEFYTDIGRKGGESTKRNQGIEHYSRIGRIGGKRAHRQKDSNELASSTAKTSR
jgi:general stress protein YciG